MLYHQHIFPNTLKKIDLEHLVLLGSETQVAIVNFQLLKSCNEIISKSYLNSRTFIRDTERILSSEFESTLQRIPQLEFDKQSIWIFGIFTPDNIKQLISNFYSDYFIDTDAFIKALYGKIYAVLNAKFPDVSLHFRHSVSNGCIRVCRAH
ncbi:MAG: hypothetical protein JWN78_1616 [Bacteroidota bacterium]|nr:hypothetical protein [Bacteroidota bacterium]